LATAAEPSAAQIGALQTVNNSPNRDHCGFGGTGSVKGVLLILDNFANIMGQKTTAKVTGISSSVLQEYVPLLVSGILIIDT